MFLTGFYSKDFILESSYGQFNFTGIAVYAIAIIGAIFTTLYSVKILYLTFLSKPNGPLSNSNAHEGAEWFKKSLSCHILPNSEDILKLLVPHDGLTAMCRWLNNSSRVISQKIIEREVDYCGSKSSIKTNWLVKEQWVDGSWHTSLCFYNKLMLRRCLRFTLAGFERNYHNRILSKLINIDSRRLFSGTSPLFKGADPSDNLSDFKVNPWWFTGFTPPPHPGRLSSLPDGAGGGAEGCFVIGITRKKKCKTGWAVQLKFEIGISLKDINILNYIKNILGVGYFYKYGSKLILYSVQSINDLEKIIDHFDKYQLITQKRADHELWKKAFHIIKTREHITMEGLRKILAIRASINQGLTDKLKAAFTDIIPVTRPEIGTPVSIDSHWLSGFTPPPAPRKAIQPSGWCGGGTDAFLLIYLNPLVNN